MEDARERECKRERKPRALRTGDSIERESSHIIDSGVKQCVSMWNCTTYIAPWPKDTTKLQDIYSSQQEILKTRYMKEREREKERNRRENINM